MPGYAAERERLILSFRGIASTTENPEVWDALGKSRGGLSGAMGMEKRGDNEWGVGRYEPEQGEKQVLWDQEFVSLSAGNGTPVVSFPEMGSYRCSFDAPSYRPCSVASIGHHTVDTQGGRSDPRLTDEVVPKRRRLSSTGGKEDARGHLARMGDVCSDSR